MALQAKCGWQGQGIALLRMIVGIVFLAHGCQKLFVYHFSGVAGMFTGIGIPLPAVSAVVVTLVELLGGLALFFGLLTRWAALLLAINMAVAVLAVHLKGGFFLREPRIRVRADFAGRQCALVLAGPGVCAFDNLICKKPTEAPPAA